MTLAHDFRKFAACLNAHEATASHDKRHLSAFLMRCLLIILLTFAIALPATAQRDRREDAEGRLRHYVEDDGALSVLTALCVLPETGGAFREAAVKPSSYTYCESSVIYRDQLEAIVLRVAIHLHTLSETEQDRFFARLADWLTATDQLRLLTHFGASEYLMAAAFATPETRAVFDPVVEGRAVDPDTLDAMFVGEVLSSHEHGVYWRKVATEVSGLSRLEQVAYYRDLYGEFYKLLEKHPRPELTR